MRLRKLRGREFLWPTLEFSYNQVAWASGPDAPNDITLGEGYAEIFNCFDYVRCHCARCGIRACHGRRRALRCVEPVLCAEHPAVPSTSTQNSLLAWLLSTSSASRSI